MNNLQKSNNGVQKQFKSLAEVRFQSPSVSRIEDRDLLTFIIKLIGEIHFKCGQQINSNELKAVSEVFKNELHLFPYITLKELSKAFNQGYKERYGKYYGLNIKTFVQWVDGYIQNERNEDLNKARSEKKIDESEISPDEKRRYIVSGMKKCIKNYEENYSILDGYTTFIYDVLFDDDYLPKDSEAKNQAIKDAKESIEIEYSGKVASNKKEHNEIKKVLNTINNPKSLTLISKAKEIIVLSFLRRVYRDEDLKAEVFKRYEIT